MTTRFIGKVLRKKVVRPLKNSVKYGNINTVNIEEKNNIEVVEEAVVETVSKKENKKTKKDKEMVNENKLAQMEAIAGTASTKTNVKIEKSEKGLYERTENSTILLTEDNKMLLTD